MRTLASLLLLIVAVADAAADDAMSRSWLNRYTIQRPTDVDLVDMARRQLYGSCDGRLRRDLGFNIQAVDSPDDGLVSGPTPKLRVAVPDGQPCASPRRQSHFEAGKFAR